MNRSACYCYLAYIVISIDKKLAIRFLKVYKYWGSIKIILDINFFSFKTAHNKKLEVCCQKKKTKTKQKTRQIAIQTCFQEETKIFLTKRKKKLKPTTTPNN